MLAYLKGKVKYKDENSAIIEVNGIGYQVFVTPVTLKWLEDKEEVELFTYQYLREREDTQELYGFNTIEEREFFKKLLGIAGIGPKGALGILSIAKLEDLKRAIIHGDVSLLTKVSGIGRKTAERIILELKNKIDVTEDIGAEALRAEEQSDAAAIDALVKLGYSQKEARQALQEISREIVEVKDKIKEALKILAKH